MLQMPFHDGRSFALCLKSIAEKNGLSMYDLFQADIVSKDLFYRYRSNQREPKVSTAALIVARFNKFCNI